VLVGATGDLARRKLLPGLFHLATTGFIPGCRIVGVSLDALDADGFREVARTAIGEFYARKLNGTDWDAFAQTLDYVPLDAGPEALANAVERAEQSFGAECRRLHYLSVPPSAALSAVRLLGAARLVERSRIVLGPAPLLVVVPAVFRVARRPAAAGEAVVADDEGGADGGVGLGGAHAASMIPSCSSNQSLVGMPSPPLYPVMRPLEERTRWQPTMSGTGLAPTAPPMARP